MCLNAWSQLVNLSVLNIQISKNSFDPRNKSYTGCILVFSSTKSGSLKALPALTFCSSTQNIFLNVIFRPDSTNHMFIRIYNYLH